MQNKVLQLWGIVPYLFLSCYDLTFEHSEEYIYMYSAKCDLKSGGVAGGLEEDKDYGKTQ